MVDHTVEENIMWLGDIYQDNAMSCNAMQCNAMPGETSQDNASLDKMMTLLNVASTHRLNRTSINKVSISEI